MIQACGELVESIRDIRVKISVIRVAMYLKKLEIYGFKSFAHKTVLEFEPGITSIVGPNGSGKSNIADGLRWAFGEQSMKLLRGKRAEDVIFAGSDHKARLGVADVSIHFDNADHSIPIDYDEVVIERRLYRDGNSDYLINGNQVRLLDTQELLVKSGFGNTSYSVIGQGMIDQLIFGGPPAVKQLVEEAAGVAPYYVKRERTLRRLGRTEINLEQVRALIAEIEPRLRSLRRQTRKLEQRADLEQKLTNALVLHYGQIFRVFEAQIQEIRGKLEVFNKQARELASEIERFSTDIETQEQETKKGDLNYKKFKADLEGLHQEKLALQEELATIRGQLKVEQQHPSPPQAIIWQNLKAKFQIAYQRLLGLFKNYNATEAAAVQDLFGEVAEMIEAVDSGSARGFETNLGRLQSQERKLTLELEGLFGRIKGLEVDLQKYADEEEATRQQLFVKERLLRNKQETLVKTAEQKNLLVVEEAKLLTRKEAYEEEARVALGLDFQEKIARSKGVSVPPGLPEKIASLKRQLEVIGGVDDLVMQEYQETEQRYQYLTSQCADLEKGVADLKTIILELDVIIKKEFNEAFAKISEKFAEYFRILFNGGRATMTILRERVFTSPLPLGERNEGKEEEEEEAEIVAPGRTEIAGIEIKATPPGKRLGGIPALSGGERALTSIALLSALLATYPSPFVILDEVDAALDEANSIRFGQILGTLAHQTQFITITHNRETMRQSHTLYGVTMGEDGISKVLSLKLEQAAEYSSKN